VLLFSDAVNRNSPARIGLLDVGGATLEDVNAFSTWQDPEASSRGSPLVEETTQGNGGKAYMYRMFRGSARLLGVKERRRNCKGFEGPPDSLERGTPGFVPSDAAGRDVPDCQWEHELQVALQPYNLRIDELPAIMQEALQAREAFTLVEGADPLDFPRGRIDASTLIDRLLCHDQAVLAVQQLRVFAVHNGRLLYERNLELAPIAPYPGFESERVFEIPDPLPNEDEQPVSTRRQGSHPGRLILRTSDQNMNRAHFRLRARWRMSYWAGRQNIGAKSIAELAPNSPGSYFIYGEVELGPLDEYVTTGRVRPVDGPLVNALDRFIGDRIRDLARELSDRRRQEQDQGQLDEIHAENRLLDRFKNRFLSSAGIGGTGSDGTNGQRGGPPGGPGPEGYVYGTQPNTIRFMQAPAEPIHLGRGVTVHLETILCPRIKDVDDRTVRGLTLEWFTGDRHVAEVVGESLVARGKGETELWARLSDTGIESERRVQVKVLNVDHVLLTPRSLEIPLGTRARIIAEVTDDEGSRVTDVYLQWAHDADDPMIVRISPFGSVFGNRVGQTYIRAGAGDLAQGEVWSRIPVEIRVVPNEQRNRPGGGSPQLLVTSRDIDPDTGDIRPDDPDRPSLNQEVSDYDHNIWWLNLGAPDAGFFSQQRTSNPQAWRGFHAQKLVEMVGQVRIREELNGQSREERPEVWARHKAMLEEFQIELMAQMWQALQPYILTGQGIE
jgi:hypothetical protein